MFDTNFLKQYSNSSFSNETIFLKLFLYMRDVLKIVKILSYALVYTLINYGKTLRIFISRKDSEKNIICAQITHTVNDYNITFILYK